MPRGSELLQEFQLEDMAEPTERYWYEVTLGLGEFSVRAADSFFAIAKVEEEADRLEKIGVVIGLRTILIDDTAEDKAIVKEKIWHEGASEVMLHSLSENSSGLLPKKTRPVQDLQEGGRALFDLHLAGPYKRRKHSYSDLTSGKI